jgi:hypothetical protein
VAKKKPQPGTIEWLRTFPSFRHCSDEEAKEALKEFDKIVEELIPMIEQQADKAKVKKRKHKKN